ncbi:MAG: hypothetical protein IPH58_15530 [Sphingobacteriales bacterium]|nr:hypothetical protein [Sphingobacteriales bacterium]
METNNTSDRAGIMHAHIEACRTSGHTVVSYCKEHRLAASKYYYWQKRFPINAATTPAFTQVTPIATHGSAATICYPNGVRLELGSINIAVLKELLCCI